MKERGAAGHTLCSIALQLQPWAFSGMANLQHCPPLPGNPSDPAGQGHIFCEAGLMAAE